MPCRSMINFGAGPAKLPPAVLKEAQEALFDLNGTGIGVLETSHRSKTFHGILEDAEGRLKALLKLQDSHVILFMQGGGTLQFSAIPMNLLGPNDTADYVITGHWSRQAYLEAKRLGFKVNGIEMTGRDSTGQLKVMEMAELRARLTVGAKFIYYCDNETIDGVEMPSGNWLHNQLNGLDWAPHFVSDHSSNFLSRPLDMSRLDLVFATAQKNIGPAGVTVVVIRKELIDNLEGIPLMLDYGLAYKHRSLYNTPPVFSIFVTGLVLRWLQETFRDLEQVDQFSRRKADMIYSVINESSGFYRNPVPAPFRSRMNVVIRIGLGEAAENECIEQASKEHGMVQLKGHRSSGGLRASLYNAITEEETATLTGHLRAFSAAKANQL